MSKASSSDWVVRLIMAVIIFLFTTSILWVAGKNVLIQIGEMLGIIQKSDVEKAILCSIYRCTEGCMSMKVQELSWKEGDKTVSCNDFCQKIDKIKDPKLRVCAEDITILGTTVTDYPVEINLKKEQKIDKTHLTLGSADYKDVECILPLSSNYQGPPLVENILRFLFGEITRQQLLNLGKAITGGKIGDNFLVVNASIIKQPFGGYGTREDCYSEAVGLLLSHDAYQQLMIRPSKLKIYTSKMEFLSYSIVHTFVTGD